MINTKVDKKNTTTAKQKNAVQCIQAEGHLCILIDKVSSNFFGQGALGSPEKVAGIYPETFAVDVTPRNTNIKPKKKYYVEDCSIYIDPNVLPRVLTPYDKSVLEAYCTIIYDRLKSGEKPAVCTAKEILQQMTSFSNKSTQGSNSVKRVVNSMTKMRVTLVSFDWTQQAKLYKIDDEKNVLVIRQCNLIPADQVYKVQRNGSTVIAYEALEMPKVYIYAESLRQIATVSSKIVEMENVSFTDTNIVMRDYLIMRIERMKRAKKRGKDYIDTIRLETLYMQCDIDTTNKTQTKRHRDTIFKILDWFKKKEYIDNYAKMMKGQVIYSIEILL